MLPTAHPPLANLPILGQLAKSKSWISGPGKVPASPSKSLPPPSSFPRKRESIYWPAIREIRCSSVGATGHWLPGGLWLGGCGVSSLTMDSRFRENDGGRCGNGEMGTRQHANPSKHHQLLISKSIQQCRRKNNAFDVHGASPPGLADAPSTTAISSVVSP